MIRKLKLVLCFILINTMVWAGNYTNNREPLTPKKYCELPLGAIKAEGWLRMQLDSMAKGMTGNLDHMYPEVMSDVNGWLGGNGHAWERGPYWIDGLVPLAYILENDTLIEKAQKWIDWAINSQDETGFFGPDRPPKKKETSTQNVVKNTTRDWWPRMVMLKALKQYYTATEDKRVIELMTNYFKFQLKELPSKPIGYYTSYWSGRRGGDNLLIVYWLYNITGDEFLLDLAQIIHKQTFNWTESLSDYTVMSRLFSYHTVNLAQGIKEPIIFNQQADSQHYANAVEQGFKDIRHFIGWPTGLYAGDEHTHTNNPNQGSELCTAVEMMYSLEKMLEITGKIAWADKLERVTFNALPTQITDNADARQYYQQCNQIEISKKVRNFQTNYEGTDQLFGLLTGYPCCTSNLHQGWPKFVQNLWYATNDNGLAALVYSPNTVTAKVGEGISVQVNEETGYPFDEQIKFTLKIKDKKIKSVQFPMHLRIPKWCKMARVTINGKPHKDYEGNQVVVVDRDWKTGDVLVLELPMKIKTQRWYENSVSVERGPLVYALKIGERWEKTVFEKKVRYGDYYEVFPTTPWNYGLKVENIKPAVINEQFVVVKRAMDGKYPWNLENAPIEIQTNAKRMNDWKEYNGNAGPLPYSPGVNGDYGESETVTLIPYGCTTLRIAEFPTVKEKKKR
ncbi:MAG: glycoside hydrolase family 127 protein [Bacteroidales bacterium]|nr:glycoside hydrolase family 127 protein [Bacteroidales bacterium]